MSRVFIGSSINALEAGIQTVFNQLEDQLNGGTEITGIIGNVRIPEGMQIGDVVIIFDGTLKVGIFTGANLLVGNVITNTQLASLQHYRGDTISAAPASLIEFPNDGDWGYHTDTGGSTYSLAKNKAGVIYTTLLT